MQFQMFEKLIDLFCGGTDVAVWLFSLFSNAVSMGLLDGFLIYHLKTFLPLAFETKC